MALFLLSEEIDEGLCGHVTLEAESREAALSFILQHWERLMGGFGGCFKGLNDQLRDQCERRGVEDPRQLSPADLEAAFERSHIDGDSEAKCLLRSLDPIIDTKAGPPPTLRKW